MSDTSVKLCFTSGSMQFLKDDDCDRRFFPVAAAAPGLNRAQRRAQERADRRVHTRAREPGRIMANAMQVVKLRATRLTDEERAGVMRPARDGLTALVRGVATHDEWAYVSSAITMALAIEDQGIVKGLREHLAAAERAIDAVWTRVEQHPDGASWGRNTTLYFDEIAALREAVNLHDFQLQQLAVSEIHAAAASAQQNVRAAGGREIARPADVVSPPLQRPLL